MSRNKVEYRTTSKENYTRFLKINKISSSLLSFKRYTRIIQTCNWMFMEYALETGEIVKLPHGFGNIEVIKKKLKLTKNFEDKKYINLRVDWAKSKAEGKRIYHTNEHSDGYNYRWIWKALSARFFLSSLYNFKPCRYASRAIARYIKKPNSLYSQMYLEQER